MLLAPLTAPLFRRFIFPAAATRRRMLEDEVEIPVRGVTLRGRVAHPESDRAVVYFAGNGEDATGWIRRFSQACPDRAVYLINYRGYGASDGPERGIASARTLVDDSVALVDLVAARHPGRPVAVVGRSIGSGIALQVARHRLLDRLALVTPFDSLAAVAADIPPRLPRPLVELLMPDRLDSSAAATEIACPVLVLRAGRDAVVRPARTAALMRAFDAPGVDVDEIEFPTADHRSIALEDGYWSALRSFLV